MSAPSLQVLTIQAQQIASQIAELRRHLNGRPELATEVGYLHGAQLLVEQAHAGLSLTDPAVRAETEARLARDIAERRNRAAAAHVEPRVINLGAALKAAVAADPRA